MTAPVPAVLNLAADLIEQRGWADRDTDDDMWGLCDGAPLCIEGALIAALGIRSQTPRLDVAFSPAYRAVHAYLEMRPGRRLYEFNDAPGRTAAEVIAALRACALVEAAKVLPPTPSPAHAERAGVGS